MADASLLTDIRNMIDLSIGTPEVGVVDFCMLHAVLHCFAQQLQVLDKPVELRGAAVPPPSNANKDFGQTVSISEYVIATDKAEKPRTLKPETLERVKKDSVTDHSSAAGGRVPDHSTKSAKRPAEKRQGGRKEEGGKEDIGREEETEHEEGGHSRYTEPRQISSTEKLSLVTLSKFNVLEDVVQDLKDRVYGSMPKNEDILEEVRSQTNIKAITDMWTSLNVSSRLEAAEMGLAKLSSLVEDLIREGDMHTRPGAKSPSQLPAGQASAVQATPGQASAGQASAGQASADQGTVAQEPAEQARPHDAEHPHRDIPGTQTGNLLEQFGPPYPWDTIAAELQNEKAAVAAQLQHLRNSLDQLNKTFYNAMEDMQNGLDPKEAASKIMTAPPPVIPEVAPPVLAAPTRPVQYEAPSGADDRRPVAASRRSSETTAGIMDRLTQLEKRIKECCDGLAKDKGNVQDQLDNFQDQLDHVLHQVGTLHDDFGALNISPNLFKDLEGLVQLYQTVQDMQEQLRQVNDTARRLASEKDDRQHHMNALLEQIEILKTIKMDREDMAEAMAEKADLRMLARKVSHDQFEIACDDLSRGLEHALGKLNTQESVWQQVLDDIQREIESKLDKMELSPLKDFFNKKLRQLQDNLKQMADLRREVEAAGTAKRLLRDVNCISCDANAVMAMDNTATVPSKPMAAHMSMKPYLSYELDAIRKTQASNLPQRNLHDWETIDKQMSPKQPVRVRSETDRHICNRYCGGSHTTTTPAQRVARLGHFIKQWGPDVVPLSSGLAAGDDGRLYKVSTKEHASVGPGGAVDPTCTKKPKPAEFSRPPPKPEIPAPECRCLDGGV